MKLSSIASELTESIDTSSLLKISALIGLNWLLHEFFLAVFVKKLINNAEEIYFSRWIFYKTLSYPFGLASLLAFTLPLIISWKTFSWKKIDSAWIKSFVLVVALTLSFKYMVYDVNYFFNQIHVIDRFLLLFFFICIYSNPGFVGLFLFQLFLVRTQFFHPVGNYINIDIQLPLHLLILFLSYVYLRGLMRFKKRNFWLVLVSYAAAHYFSAGMEKVLISPNYVNWIWENKLHLMAVGAQGLGWLGNTPEFFRDGIVSLTQQYRVILNFFVVAIEILSAFVLFNSIFASIIFIGLITFQLGVFLLIGNIFWKWILILIFLIIFLYRGGLHEKIDIQGKVISSILIVLFSITALAHTPQLAWLETRYFYTFDWHAKTDKNKTYRLSRKSFSGYSLFFKFGFNKLTFLPKKKLIPDATNNYSMAKTVNEKFMLEESLENFRQKYGQRFYNPRKKRRLKLLLKQFIYNSNNSRESFGEIFQWLKSPGHLYIHSGSSKKYRLREIPGRVRSVKLKFREFFYNGNKTIPLTKTPVLTVDIPEKGK